MMIFGFGIVNFYLCTSISITKAGFYFPESNKCSFRVVKLCHHHTEGCLFFLSSAFLKVVTGSLDTISREEEATALCCLSYSDVMYILDSLGSLVSIIKKKKRLINPPKRKYTWIGFQFIITLMSDDEPNL